MVIIKTREDANKLPESWYQGIEKSKEKAEKLLHEVIAVDQTTSIIVGKLDEVSIDKLWNAKYPYCKLILKNAERYRTNGKFDTKLQDVQMCFVNKPEMIMNLEELQKRFPQIHEDVHINIKKDSYG